MTSATIRQAKGPHRGEGYGMLVFAATLLGVVGIFNQAARWFGVAVIGLNAIGQMFFIPAYPFWSLMIIAVDVVALWGPCAYGSRENAAFGRDNLPSEPPRVDVTPNVPPPERPALTTRTG